MFTSEISIETAEEASMPERRKNTVSISVPTPTDMSCTPLMPAGDGEEAGTGCGEEAEGAGLLCDGGSAGEL